MHFHTFADLLHFSDFFWSTFPSCSGEKCGCDGLGESPGLEEVFGRLKNVTCLWPLKQVLTRLLCVVVCLCRY